MIIFILLLSLGSVTRVDFHWNRPQSQFLTTCGVPNGPTEYIDFEGAVRAGKSTPCAAKLARYAVRYPGIHMAAARWTQDAIDAQIKPLWRSVAQARGLALEWHGDEQYDEVLGTGAKIYLRGIHASEDTQRYSKLAGLTLAVLWLDQPEEISNDDEDVVLAYVPARLSQVGYPHEVWFTPNPVGNDHWVAQWFPLDDPRPHYTYIHTNIYDNRQILGDAYIADMEERHPAGTAFRMRFVDGHRGLGMAGKPVYAGYFLRNVRADGQQAPWHVRRVAVDRRFPIYEGWDFGYSHPAVLWTQYLEGQWRVVGEYLGTNQGVDEFADAAVELRARLFPDVQRYESVCDPAGFAKGAGLQGTVVDLFAKKGIYFADYDSVKGYNHPMTEYGAIQSTMRILRSTVKGQPAMVIDPRCQNFILGMEAGYIWSDRQYAGTMGSVKTPDKKRDTEYNHLQDCWLYTLLRFGSAAQTTEQTQRQLAKYERLALQRSQKDYDPFKWTADTRRGRGGY
jgi:PBSX family phage terminase large subunit